MNNENERTLIFEFEKNSSEVVRTSISEFKGKLYVDFRAWEKPDLNSDRSGEARPTKKGLTISTELLPDLLKAVQAAISHVRDSKKDAESGDFSAFPE